MATGRPISVTRGLAACRRALARMAAAGLVRALTLAGYPTSPMRDHVAPQELLKRRRVRDQRHVAAGPKALARLLEHTKAEYDRHVAGDAGGRAGDQHPDHLGRRRLGSLRGGISQGMAAGPRPAPARETRVRHRDGGEHRHADRAVRVPRRPAVDRAIVQALSQPGGGLGEAARDAVLPAEQHLVRRGARTGTRDARTSHHGHGSPHRGGGRRRPAPGGQHDQPRRRRVAGVRPGGGSAARRRLGPARPHPQHHARLGGHSRRLSVPDDRRASSTSTAA